MNWGEFRAWAWDTYRYRFTYNAQGSEWKRLWSSGQANVHRGSANVGSGHSAMYGLAQQRRLAMHLRIRDLIAAEHLAAWLDAAEQHANGWLVNDGDGLRWVRHPEKEASMLAGRGFIAVKCGL